MPIKLEGMRCTQLEFHIQRDPSGSVTSLDVPALYPRKLISIFFSPILIPLPKALDPNMARVYDCQTLLDSIFLITAYWLNSVPCTVAYIRFTVCLLKVNSIQISGLMLNSGLAQQLASTAKNNMHTQ